MESCLARSGHGRLGHEKLFNGAENFGGFSDTRVDALLAALADAWEPVERAPIAAELAVLLAERCPLAALPAPDPFGLLSRRVRGANPWNGWVALRELTLVD